MVSWSPIWCLFALLTKALNIQDSRTSVIPKVGVHSGAIGFNLLHSFQLVKVCFTFEHTFLASCALASHTWL
jgi:hypothetical protein